MRLLLKLKKGQERLKRENKARAEKILSKYEQANAKKLKNAEEEAEGDTGPVAQFEPDMTKWSEEKKLTMLKDRNELKR